MLRFIREFRVSSLRGRGGRKIDTGVLGIGIVVRRKETKRVKGLGASCGQTLSRSVPPLIGSLVIERTTDRTVQRKKRGQP